MTELIDVNLEQEQEFLEQVFDLEDEKDREELGEELNSGSMFFKPVSNISYKVRLTDSKIKTVFKKFADGNEIIKYELCITAKGSDKTEFEGVWQVGKQVAKAIFDDYEKDAVFNIKKTGSGLDTRYSITKDF